MQWQPLVKTLNHIHKIFFMCLSVHDLSAWISLKYICFCKEGRSLNNDLNLDITQVKFVFASYSTCWTTLSFLLWKSKSFKTEFSSRSMFSALVLFCPFRRLCSSPECPLGGGIHNIVWTSRCTANIAPAGACHKKRKKHIAIIKVLDVSISSCTHLRVNGAAILYLK